VVIAPQLAFTDDRPVFSPIAGATMRRGTPTPIRLDAVTSVSNVLRAAGTFPVRWADLDGNGVADDLNGDGNPDVLPIVVAELLDPADASNLSLATPHTLLYSLIDPGQFAGQGFPATDPTQLRRGQRLEPRGHLRAHPGGSSGGALPDHRDHRPRADLDRAE
jgi:hypothetical protein